MSDPFAGMASTLAAKASEEPPPRPARAPSQSKRTSLPEVANPMGMTPMECAAMDGVIQGKSSFTIGEELGISHKTVDSHIDKAKQRLNVDSKLMAALEWDRWTREQP